MQFVNDVLASKPKTSSTFGLCKAAINVVQDQHLDVSSLPRNLYYERSFTLPSKIKKTCKWLVGVRTKRAIRLLSSRLLVSIDTGSLSLPQSVVSFSMSSIDCSILFRIQGLSLTLATVWLASSSFDWETAFARFGDDDLLPPDVVKACSSNRPSWYTSRTTFANQQSLLFSCETKINQRATNERRDPYMQLCNVDHTPRISNVNRLKTKLKPHQNSTRRASSIRFHTLRRNLCEIHL
jgi:hypothetical protein